MARYALQGVARDGNGNIISSATVTVYPADSGTAATVYTAKSGGTAVTTGIVTADTNGRWVAYLDDTTYPLGNMFDITVDKAGYDTQTYEDVR